MTKIFLALKYAFSDLRRQKIRTILGIIGVCISVSLLGIILFLSDSISVGFIDYLSADAGDVDIGISIRHYNGEPANRSDYFEYDPIIEKVEEVTDLIEFYIPRMAVSGVVNVSEGFSSSELTNFQEATKIVGINFSLENEYNFGDFLVPDENELLDLQELPMNHCAIYYGFNDKIRYAEGEEIEINMTLHLGEYKIIEFKNFTIDKIFDFDLKFPNRDRSRNLIIVDIQTLYNIFSNETMSFEGMCSQLIMTFKEGTGSYDIRDIEGSEKNVKEIGANIQLALGLNEYNIELPKLRILGWAEMISVIVTVIFIFVSIVAMLIAGILINGILKTSVEERIREFGIFRTLGANQNYNLYIVLLQGFLLCNFGAIAGIFLALFSTQYLIVPFANEYVLAGTGLLGNSDFEFAFTLESIIISYSMGAGVGVFVSLSPALKVRNLQLIESIHPYRHEDTLYHLQKKASVNYKLIIVGIILASNGGFIYFVIPRMLFTAEITLFAVTLITVLLIFLIGLTLAGLGLMPVVLRLTIELFRPFSKRLHHVIKIFVFRYQRRNTSTIVTFALSFSFAIFTASFLQSISNMMSLQTRLSHGSDLVMETIGWDETSGGGGFGGFGMGFGGGGMGFFSLPTSQNSNQDHYSYDPPNPRLASNGYLINPNKLLTTEFEKGLLSLEGIEKVSSVLASPQHLTQIYSKERKEFSAEIGDYAGLSTQSVELFGIDEEFSATVDNNYIVFTRGSMADSFGKLFNEGNYTCIISEGLAVSQSLNLGDRVRMQIQRGEESEIYPFTIVGMASSMPGFSYAFSGSSMGRGGVLISHDTYSDIIDIPTPSWVDKIFIKVKENYDSEIVEDKIDEIYIDEYNYDIVNLARLIERQQLLFTILDTLFMVILVATVFICLFGLLSSSYSAIIERKKEIGIIRTLGLQSKEINRLFIVEALIIMFSSGSIGVLIGWLTGWLLNSTLTTLTDTPSDASFPWLHFYVIYIASVIFVLVGMRLLLRKAAKKKKIVEIYRETM